MDIISDNIIDGLRPYSDNEIPAAMERLASHEYFVYAAHFIFPNMTLSQAREKILKVRTVRDFQMEWMYHFNRRVIETTMEKFSFRFDSPLMPCKGYLFISNHRDIVLDSSLLQMVLADNGYDTSYITYGDNLIINRLAEDIARSNKMFKVVRQGNKRDLFNHSVILSRFMREKIQENQSCWIAQRSGRTKNGNDSTSHALVKMFSMSGPQDDLIANYEALHIVPVSVSYEYEPCDYLKTGEITARMETEEYEKRQGEDLNSILTGITQWKGNVHIHFGTPLTREDLQPYAALDKNAFCSQVCGLIDRQIVANYKLYPSNYVAFDLQEGTPRFKDFYTLQQKEAFLARMEKLKVSVPGDKASGVYLGIYANPVKAAMELSAVGR